MAKFVIQSGACAAFAISLCFSAFADETRDVTHDAGKGKSGNECNSPGSCQDYVPYVSGKGRNFGGCASPAYPCRTFQYAVDHTIAGGEVKALDPADYGQVRITKSITITGVDGAGIDAVDGPAVHAITAVSDVGAGAVKLSNLVIQKVKGSGGAGASAIFGNYLEISRCTIRGFDTGISIGLNGRYLITNSIVTNNNVGINLGDVSGTLDHVIASNNSTGIVFGTGTHSVVDTIANNNSQTGIYVFIGANVFLARSTVSGNATGVDIPGPGPATSFGDNHIKGNGKDIVGKLVNVGTQ
jgi:hypothetical protein